MTGLLRRFRRGQLGTPSDHANFRTLHSAALAAPALRTGLTTPSARKALPHLQTMLGGHPLALTDAHRVLATSLATEPRAEGSADLVERAREAIALGRSTVTEVELASRRQKVVSAPLTVDGVIIGVLQAAPAQVTGALVRATEEVADWVGGQLELAALEESRHRIIRAEVRALRAQISPHFIYNSLTTIASFVRTDPERARELLLEFADFTRYSFRQHGEFTTLAEELRSIERYLALEQARFGPRLEVRLRIAPEILSVKLPFLCLQPLVENAVRHGLEAKPGRGTIEIVATNHEDEAVIYVEDDGVGEDPHRVLDALVGSENSDGERSVGLANVDARLRATYGDAYGLLVETSPGEGTKVTVRLPKFAPGVVGQP